MEDLFYRFWWLLFPLAFMALGMWRSWLRYLRHRDHLDLMRVYAAQGRVPPAAQTGGEG